jgi:hypothetical protein
METEQVSKTWVFDLTLMQLIAWEDSIASTLDVHWLFLLYVWKLIWKKVKI